jgi:hypothetical protein
MNAQLARALTAQRNDELTATAARSRAAAEIPAPRRRVPHWRVNWSRTTLTPAGSAGRRERSWVIIISATTRSA